MLPLNLHQILRTELETDPLKLGYCKYGCENRAMVASLLNGPRNITRKIEIAITDPTAYLDALEESTNIENIQYVKRVLTQLPPQGQMYIAQVAIDAIPVYEFLENNGVDAFLNILGISHLVGEKDKPLFEKAAKDILYHAAYLGVSYFYVTPKRETRPPRISEIFAGIEGAPNFITEQDIQDVIEAKIKDGSFQYHI